MNFTFTVLGSSSATPTSERHPSAHLLNANGHFFLLDAGEGVQMQLRKYGLKIQKIEKIFITHLHGDHYFGLIGLLNTFQLLGRTNRIDIYCPKGLQEVVELQLKVSQGWLQYPYEFHEWETSEEEILIEDEDILVERFPLKHRIPCCGYRFILKPGKRKINLEAVNRYDVPTFVLSDIQSGADYILEDGTIIPNAELTLVQADPKVFTYCTDTVQFDELGALLQGTDVLYHETTFMHQDVLRAKETFHSTTIEAAEVALKVGVKKLIIGHFSARYKDLNPLLIEARTVFENTELAKEGQVYEI